MSSLFAWNSDDEASISFNFIPSSQTTSAPLPTVYLTRQSSPYLQRSEV